MGIHCQLVIRGIGDDLAVARSTNWLIKRTLRRGQCLWCSMTSSVKQCIITTPCQTLRGETVEVSSKQLVINTPCQTGIGVFVEISKQAVRYQDTLSNRDRNDCWNFQGSSAACSKQCYLRKTPDTSPPRRQACLRENTASVSFHNPDTCHTESEPN